MPPRVTQARFTAPTTETFHPFHPLHPLHEAHFRLLTGEVVLADQHGDCREQTASSPPVPGSHLLRAVTRVKPRNSPPSATSMSITG